MNGTQVGIKTPPDVERLATSQDDSIGVNGTIRPVADDRPLTVPEVAERLRVGTKCIYEHADQLGAYRVGKLLRFDWEHVKERLRSGAVGKLVHSPNRSHEFRGLR
jgi:excisionase family DNA binding protein